MAAESGLSASPQVARLEISMSLRRSLCQPIPQVFAAAENILSAANRHLNGDFAGAESDLRKANDPEVWAYTDQAWGKGAAVRYEFLKLVEAPPRLAFADRPIPRMADVTTRKAVLARDGYHCRFCGIPVIDGRLRQKFKAAYPAAVSWGATNVSQHAGFQCMWLQFDHILPNGRGGESSLNNIVVACAACNFGRMDATLEEARLIDPLSVDPPVAWKYHAVWDGLEQFAQQAFAL